MTTEANTPTERPAQSLREQVRDMIASHLAGTYHCGRVWEAWSCGTMTQDDFSDVGDSDTPEELTEEIMALITAAEQKPAPVEYMPILGTPFAVRMDILDNDQAHRNHRQSLDKLRSRGGLGMAEAAAIADRRRWRNDRTEDAAAGIIKAAQLLAVEMPEVRA